MPKEKPKDKYGTLLRLLGYGLRYRWSVFFGVLFSLLVSISNLFSLTMLVPVFNSLGATGPVQLFEIGASGNQALAAYRNDEDIPIYETVNAVWTGWKVSANESVAGKSSREVIFLLCLLILPVYFLKLLFVTLAIWFIGTAGLQAVRDLRFELYQKTQTLGMDYFSQKRTGFVMSRVINDVQLIARSLSIEFNDSLINIFYVVTHLLFLAFVSWEMIIVIFVIIPIFVAPINRFAEKIRKAAMGQQERLAEMGAHMQEVISGIRVIRAFSMENFERGRFDQVNQRLYRNTFRGHYFHQVGPAITEFIATVIVLGFLAWGAYTIANGKLDKGLFFAIFFVLVFIMRPIKQISVMLNIVNNMLVAGERVFEMLDTPVPLAERPGARPFQALEEGIEFQNVGFRYPGTGEDVLRNIDLSIRPGQTLALVGSSGAGKSTLVDLLPRMYDVSSGALLLDGVDVRDYTLGSLRRGIGIVSQNIFLFNATVRENIAYGRDEIPMEKIQAVARAANAHDFIQQLEQGYETPIGERGVMLSGGQRQRIAIARALLLDPPVLIFDEATSALDNESEQLVQLAIERLLKGRTVIIIAHRLSTVFGADRIVVLDRGRIVEQGTHQELLEGGQVYKKLYEMQFVTQ